MVYRSVCACVRECARARVHACARCEHDAQKHESEKVMNKDRFPELSSTLPIYVHTVLISSSRLVDQFLIERLSCLPPAWRARRIWCLR